MPKQLPSSPHPMHLRKEAKAVLKAQRNKEKQCCDVLRNLHRFGAAKDSEILAADISLAAVQYSLAKDYGFRNWVDLMAEASARSGSNDNTEPEEARTRFTRVTTHDDGERLLLEPIPRYPYSAQIVDENGKVLRHERDRALNNRIVGNLYCAMNMQGHDLSWPVVAAASGDLFRFAFEPSWAQDAEYVTDVDHFDLACKALGFDFTKSRNAGLSDSLELIDASLSAGRAPIISGWGERFMRVVAGKDRKAGTYICIGGVDFHEGIPMEETTSQERLSDHMHPEACPSCPIPTTDWHGAVLSPEQAALNPVFVVGGRATVPTIDQIRSTLQNALPMNTNKVIKRTNIELRKLSLTHGPAGHDGWKFYYSPWEGRFTMGSDGFRAWATHVEHMVAPVANFELVHGIDTTFGGMQRAKAIDAVSWFRWAEQRVPDSVKRYLEDARMCFTRIARYTQRDLGLIRTVPCYLDNPVYDTPRDALLKMLSTEPSLIYLINDEERAALGDEAPECFGSPFGWRILPGTEAFEAGKAMVSRNLNDIANNRDAAFEAMAQALNIL